MISIDSILNEYWKNEAKLSEARKTFFDKGIIKRDLVSDQLAFSWLRCKYKNLNAALNPINEPGQCLRVPLNHLKRNGRDFSSAWIGLFNTECELIQYSGNPILCDYFSKVDFKETTAGYNAIAYVVEHGGEYVTTGFEHYNEYFCEYMIIGISMENHIYGLIIPLQDIDAQSTTEILRHISYDLFKSINHEYKALHLDCFFFRKDIAVFDRCLKSYQKLVDGYGLLHVFTDSVYNAKLLAQEIHRKSKRNSGRFEYICGKNMDYIQLDDLLNCNDPMTIVVEDLRWFSTEMQGRLLRFIDSKLINSKSGNNLYTRDVAIIIHEYSNADCLLKLPDVMPGLQMRLKNVSLSIPNFLDIGLQFKSYLSSEFERMISKAWNRDLALSEEALNALTQYDWPEQYRELEYMVNEIGAVGFNGSEVPLSALPSYILRNYENSVETTKLKDKERQWILQMYALTKGNMKKTSELLGITRSTLYRKMLEYGVKVDIKEMEVQNK